MQSTICSRQNSKINLKRRVAFNKLYSESKMITNIKLLFMFIIGLIYLSYDVCLMFNVNLLQISYVSFVAPFLSIFFTIIDNLFLKKLIKEKIEIAVLIQEEFDCDVLNIQVNPLKYQNMGDYILNKKYDNKLTDSQKNWYGTSLDNVTESVATLIAQKINVFWEKGLNERFINLLKIILIITIILIGTNVIATWNYDLKNILYGIFSLMYTLNLFLELYNTNISIQQTNNKINNYIDENWNKILKNEKINLDILIRQIQDELFNYRLNTFLIPDWFYNSYKHSDEEISKILVSKMICEYNHRNN